MSIFWIDNFLSAVKILVLTMGFENQEYFQLFSEDTFILYDFFLLPYFIKVVGICSPKEVNGKHRIFNGN